MNDGGGSADVRARQDDGPARIVLLLQDLHMGGTQRQTLALADGLDPDHFTVEIWTLMSGDAFDLPRTRPHIPVRRLGNAPMVTPVALARLGARILRDPPDLLLCLTGVPNIWGRVFGSLAAFGGKGPIVVGTLRGRGCVARQCERGLNRLADCCVVNAHSLADVLIATCSADPDRVRVIPNGLDLGRFTPRPPAGPPADQRAPASKNRPPTAVHVGRLVPDKDQRTLLDAFALVRRDIPEARLCVVGDGPLRPTLERRARASDLSGSVEFLSWRGDVPDLLRSADVFVLSSRREGLPNALIEASACGLPVVSTHVDGAPEIVEDGVSGLLTPPGDPQALGLALSRLLGDPALRRRFGEAGARLAAERFSMPAMVESYERLFEELLAERAAERRLHRFARFKRPEEIRREAV